MWQLSNCKKLKKTLKLNQTIVYTFYINSANLRNSKTQNKTVVLNRKSFVKLTLTTLQSLALSTGELEYQKSWWGQSAPLPLDLDRVGWPSKIIVGLHSPYVPISSKGPDVCNTAIVLRVEKGGGWYCCVFPLLTRAVHNDSFLYLTNCNKWYFATKIVLTYCEKHCSSDQEKH